MTDLDRYLRQHFMTADAFASHCGIERDELADLIRRQLVPAPSYVVRDGMLESFVFGALPAPEAAAGEYFRAEMAAWVAAVRHDVSTHGIEGAQQRVRKMFADPFIASLRSSNATVYRLDDAFDANGAPLVDGLEARVASAWEHFLGGTFGLCVANPGSIHDIVRKEVLQEQLAALTDNGAKMAFAADERRALLTLIDAYASSSMPFSPIEYPRSSRKRLVDDLRARLDPLNFAT